MKNIHKIKWLKTLKEIDELGFGKLGYQGEFYACELRDEARKWIKDLENFDENHRYTFSFLGETTVKFKERRLAVSAFIRAFFNLEE